jgi:hypothetical protein
MEKLNEWIMYCLRACERAENNKLIWMHQAFGAVQYHITLVPEDYERVEKLWNKYKPQFERKVYGVSFEL